MTTEENCIFCKIAKGEILHNKIWESENCLAFLDANPIREGHTLVIPKKHYDYLFDIEDKEYTDLMINAKKVAKLLKEKLHPKRIGVIVEGFEVHHAHIHLVPINKGSDLSFSNSHKAHPEELNSVEKRIKS